MTSCSSPHALDVFTAETLRREIHSLWQNREGGGGVPFRLDSILLITHLIEEAGGTSRQSGPARVT